MKKALVVLLCIVLALSIVGCGISTTPEQEEAFKNWVDKLSVEAYVLSTTYSDLETMDDTAFFIAIRALADEAEKIIGIPETIFENYDNIFTYEKSEATSNYKTILSLVPERIDIDIFILLNEIAHVYFSMTTEDEKPYQTTHIIDNLIEEFGEPSKIIYSEKPNDFKGKESSISDIKKEFERKAEGNCTLEWEIVREMNRSYTYSFRQIKMAYGSVIRNFTIS